MLEMPWTCFGYHLQLAFLTLAIIDSNFHKSYLDKEEIILMDYKNSCVTMADTADMKASSWMLACQELVG